MKLDKVIMAAVGLVAFSFPVVSQESDFDWNNREHMRGAWKMCATTGFIEGDCPEVHRRCHQRPMVYWRRGRVRSHCTEEPNFNMSDTDVRNALEMAAERG